jgi:hypothetical protein
MPFIFLSLLCHKRERLCTPPVRQSLLTGRYIKQSHGQAGININFVAGKLFMIHYTFMIAFTELFDMMLIGRLDTTHKKAGKVRQREKSEDMKAASLSDIAQRQCLALAFHRMQSSQRLLSGRLPFIWRSLASVPSVSPSSTASPIVSAIPVPVVTAPSRDDNKGSSKGIGSSGSPAARFMPISSSVTGSMTEDDIYPNETTMVAAWADLMKLLSAPFAGSAARSLAHVAYH